MPSDLVTTWWSGPAGSATADLLVVPADPELPTYRAAGLTGAPGEDLLTAPTEGPPTLLVGMGAPAGRDAEAVRRVARRVGRAHGRKARIATTLHHGVEGGVSAVVEGLSEGAYRFDRYRRNAAAEPGAPWQVVLLAEAEDRADPESDRAPAVVADAVRWVRDLVNTPAADLTPHGLVQAATDRLQPLGVQVRTISGEELAERGCGGIVGVGQGSHHPPYLIEAGWTGPGPVTRTIALVGKGITFDSGGLCLKRGSAMLEMKSDMAGGATMLAVIGVLAELNVPGLQVTAWVPAAENMPGGGAIRPGDVLRHPNGVTSEVIDTDCEGRLVMADALALAAAGAPDAILDAATLTYSCVTAVGSKITVALGNTQWLVDAARTSGETVGEPIWQLPLWQPYLPLVTSSVADVRNEGLDGSPGCITAALFLQHFVDTVPWLHLDIGGTAWIDDADEEWAAGGTGAMVRTLSHLLARSDLSWKGDPR